VFFPPRSLNWSWSARNPAPSNVSSKAADLFDERADRIRQRLVSLADSDDPDVW
jgi:hypothetical protein